MVNEIDENIEMKNKKFINGKKIKIGVNNVSG
jgi:hypothetical protein